MSNKKRYFIVSLVSAALIGVVLAGGFLFKTNLRVAERYYLGYFFWAIESENNLNLKFLKTTTVSMPQFNLSEGSGYQDLDLKKVDWLAENADIAVVSIDELFRMENLHPGLFKAVLFYSDTPDNYMTNIVVKNNSKLTSLNHLSGQKIAVKNETDGFLLDYFLRANKITGCSLKRYEENKWSENLAEDKIAAAWVTEPQGTQYVQEEMVRKLVENPLNVTEMDLSEVPTYAIIVRDDLGSFTKLGIGRYLSMLLKASKISPDELRGVMLEHLGDKWQNELKYRTFATVQDYKEVDRELLQKLGDQMQEAGFINFKPNVGGLIYED